MPEPLSSDRIIEAGVALVRREGWAALGVRAVATDLGVTPMALYKHVAGAEGLVEAVRERVLATTAAPRDTGDLRADLTDWARRFHADLTAAPGLGGWLLVHWFESAAVLERVDALLELVTRHGVDGFEAVAVVNAVFMYALMRAEAERQVRTAGVVQRRLRTAASARPLDRLRSLADHYTTAELDKHFAFGLDALVRGLPLPDREGP